MVIGYTLKSSKIVQALHCNPLDISCIHNHIPSKIPFRTKLLHEGHFLGIGSIVWNALEKHKPITKVH